MLAGVEGPDDALKLPSTAERQLRMLAKLVADDPTLGSEIPDLRALVTRILAAAQARPLIIPFTDAQSKRTVQVTLGRFDL